MNTTSHFYRGDFERISRFERTKTSRLSLVGSGIYLTSSLKVARSYCTKGTRKHRSYTLFNGLSKSRVETWQKAFKSFCEIEYADMTGKYHQTNLGKFEEFCLTMRDSFERLKEEQVITLISSPYSRFSHEPVHVVVYQKNPNLGWVSEFSFATHEFETAVFDVDKYFTQRFFWEQLFDAGINFGYSKAKNRKDYVDENMQTVSVTKGSLHTFRDWPRLERFLKPYGYRGFEYRGGRHLGGIDHRAFCIWDEDWVNDHFVRRFR